ncbi:MAG TPA: phosphodiesterase [Patescibacteria group bacterium]|nr:phosphodiesterase [Patescibacteria group bacterium]
MKIGITSDTHGCLQTWESIYNRFFNDADLIIHAGDVLYHGPRNAIPAEYNPKQLAETLNQCPIPLVIACGNCDAEIDGMILNWPVQSPYASLRLEGLSIMVNHGHHLTDLSRIDMAKRFKSRLFITGHSHVASLEKQDGVVYLNPGSPGLSKRSDHKGTIALLTDGRVQILDINTGEVLMEETCTII